MLHMDFTERPVRRRRQKRPAQVSWPYVRGTDGVWRYPWGEPVPGARDVTLGERYGFPVVEADRGPAVRVPIRMFRDPELSWAYGRYYDPRSKAPFVLVPIEVWKEHTSEVVGMDAPELDAARMLDTASVAARCGCSVRTISSYLARSLMPLPVVRVGGSPLWTEPVITRWQETRPGRGGRPRRGAPTGRERVLDRMGRAPTLSDVADPDVAGRRAPPFGSRGGPELAPERDPAPIPAPSGRSSLVPTSGLLRRNSAAGGEGRGSGQTSSTRDAGSPQVLGEEGAGWRQAEYESSEERGPTIADLGWRATPWADVPDEELDEPQLEAILSTLEAKAAERRGHG